MDRMEPEEVSAYIEKLSVDQMLTLLQVHDGKGLPDPYTRKRIASMILDGVRKFPEEMQQLPACEKCTNAIIIMLLQGGWTPPGGTPIKVNREGNENG
jgi:hypothetical protein